MTTTIPATRSTRSAAAPADKADAFRKPLYDCRDQGEAMQLVVFIPGVDAAGVNIEARGTDLRVTARKTRFVRVNWQALHLENAQRDYRLSLRLGRGFAYEDMDAEIHQGVLTITLPKRAAARGAAIVPSRLRRVA